jgi:dTDP-4-amino-4,6-dideoxygalactose transaminase
LDNQLETLIERIPVMHGCAPKIPALDLTPEIDLLWNDIQAAIADVMRSGQFILGPQVRSFEEEMARVLAVKHAVACNSGTDALVLGLRALGIGQGDEVITTPFTFFATAEAISLVGAEPVFVDIDPRTLNIDPRLIPEALTPRTKAIVPVHLFGHPADMDPILEIARDHNLVILEDVAQAFGGRFHDRPLGTLGNAGAFSFYPTKNLGAFGDAGLLTTNDDKVAHLARKLRTHGAEGRNHNEIVGYNSRLDEIQAAVLRVKLPYVEMWNRERRRAAATYRRLLADVPGIVAPIVEEYAVHSFNQYTIRVTACDRDALQRAMADAGVGTMVYYSVPVHRLPVYADHHAELPVAEKAAREVLSLPIGPMLSNHAIGRVVDVLRQCLPARTGGEVAAA